MIKFISKYFILSLVVIFAMLLAVSFFTLLERKILAGIQRRQGPVFTGHFGLLQPFADGFKLFLKEISNACRRLLLYFSRCVDTFLNFKSIKLKCNTF